jgi:hypothetical protein
MMGSCGYDSATSLLGVVASIASTRNSRLCGCQSRVTVEGRIRPLKSQAVPDQQRLTANVVTAFPKRRLEAGLTVRLPHENRAPSQRNLKS